jgi:hypothetical protein
MDDHLRNRKVAPEKGWLLPIVPPAGIGVATPTCEDRSDVATFPIRVGEGLRVGGEGALCLRCGPEGSVYHPASLFVLGRKPRAVQVASAMASLRKLADRLPFATGYDPADLTPAVMTAYEQSLRRQLGLHE